MQHTIHILIVEDEPLIAEDIAGYLQSGGYSNTTIVYNGSDALEKLNHGTVDFLLLDVNLESEWNGIQLAQKINSDYHLPFAFITSYADASTIKEVAQVHPVGYIVKPFKGKEIPAIITIGLELYYTYMGPDTSFDTTRLNKLASEDLTQKEAEVLLKIAAGMNNKQIAEELFVSVNTVKTHLKNIFVKLNISSRAEAIVLLANVKKK